MFIPYHEAVLVEETADGIPSWSVIRWLGVLDNGSSYGKTIKRYPDTDDGAADAKAYVDRLNLIF